MTETSNLGLVQFGIDDIADLTKINPSMQKIDSEFAKKASLSGASFTGPVSVGPTNNVHFTAYSQFGYVRTFGGNPDGILLDVRNTTDMDNRRLLTFCSALGRPSIADSLEIIDVINSNYYGYKLYGEHNMPMQLVAFLQPGGDSYKLNRFEMAKYFCIGEWNVPFTFGNTSFRATNLPTILSAQVIPYDTTSIQWYNSSGETSLEVTPEEVIIKATSARVRIFKQKLGE